jgi:hypothetical protein
MRQSNQARRLSLKTVAPEVQMDDRATMANNGPTDAEIRQRAHAIYLSRRGAHGDPVADWLRAEQELRAQANGLPTEERS